MTLIAFACNDNTKATVNTTDTLAKQDTTPLADTAISGCYSMTANRDTASLQLQRKGTIITGSLSYNLFEKDHNDGTFQGEMGNGLLTGWYLFRSEGVISVRQVAWKIGNGYLWPGNGEVMMRHDTTMFVNVDKLSFDQSRAFVKVKCTI